MENGVFKRRRRISNIIIALWLIVPALVASAGIAATVMAAAQYPWIHWGNQGYWVLAFFSTPGLIYGFYALARSLKYRRSMRYYRVDEDDIRRFEREYRYGERRRYGKTVITAHWLFSSYAASTCLLPLKEAAWIYNATAKGRSRHGGEYSTYGIKVHFRDGAALYVKCEKHNIDRALREFAERCPQAQFGYSDGRERAWKEGVKQWRISQ